MSGMWRKLWRWITLADIPDEFVPRTCSRGSCDYCDEPWTCLVTINTRSWRTCLSHIRRPSEDLIRGGP